LVKFRLELDKTPLLSCSNGFLAQRKTEQQ